LDLGARWGSERPKNQSAQNIFKTDVCVGLDVTNPTQLERAQTDIVCSRYHDLFVLPNRQTFDDCIVYTVRTMPRGSLLYSLYDHTIDVVGYSWS
jgi:hypothetical protein